MKWLSLEFMKWLSLALALMAGVFLGGATYGGDHFQSHSNVNVVDFLLNSPFEGVQLDGPTMRDTNPDVRTNHFSAHQRLYGDLKTTSRKVSLKFSKDDQGLPRRGKYLLTIGSDRLEGEWNIHEDIVNLWIGKVNGIDIQPGEDELMSIYFRVPKVADDPFVITDFDYPPVGAKASGVLLVRVRDDIYWRHGNAPWHFPSDVFVSLDDK